MDSCLLRIHRRDNWFYSKSIIIELKTQHLGWYFEFVSVE